MPDLDRAVRSWEEWDRGIRSGDPRALGALGRLLSDIARRAEKPVLTMREIAVLQGYANGLDTAEIAVALGITRHTIKTFLKSAYVKLGARNRPHALKLAMERGLVE